MSGYITRNALMTDNPIFGPPQNSATPTTLPNPLAATAPGYGVAPLQLGPDGLPVMPAATGGNPAVPGANADLAKLLAQFYGTPGQAQPQAPTPAQQLQQAINADQANYHGREGGGLV